jgi:hypothetical protein
VGSGALIDRIQSLKPLPPFTVPEAIANFAVINIQRTWTRTWMTTMILTPTRVGSGGPNRGARKMKPRRSNEDRTSNEDGD